MVEAAGVFRDEAAVDEGGYDARTVPTAATSLPRRPPSDPANCLMYLHPVHDPNRGDHPKGGGAARGIGCAVVLVLFALMFIVGPIRALGPALQAARGEGTHGTLAIKARSCSKNGCRWSGDFVSTDNRLKVADVETDDLKQKTRVGERVVVIYVEGKAYAEGTTAWKTGVLIIVGFSIVVIGGVIWLWRFSRRA
ncbi:hypothetical protein [Planotetraspora mira]|nr:hypothetical protein [Planotetraspora mira]